MNRKQMAVLWLAVAALSFLSLMKWLDADPSLAIAVPVLLVASLAVYQVRTPRPPSDRSKDATTPILLLLLALHALTAVGSAKQASRLESDIGDVSTSVSQMELTVGDIESTVSHLESTLENVEQEVESTRRLVLFR